MSTSEVIPVISGPEEYRIDVVGESNYQAHLKKVFGEYTEDGVSTTVDAFLVLENTNKFDNKAVMVVIGGDKVGYLDRSTAREFRQAIKDGGLKKYTRFQCLALVRGGWDRGAGDIGPYGVKLDLPDEDDDEINDDD